MTDERLQQDPILAEMVRRLVEAYSPLRIYLFGSRARGDAGPDSDYDLAVVVEHSDEPGYRRAMQAYQVLWGVDASKDVLVFTRAEFERKQNVISSLPETILYEGVLLYAA